MLRKVHKTVCYLSLFQQFSLGRTTSSADGPSPLSLFRLPSSLLATFPFPASSILRHSRIPQPWYRYFVSPLAQAAPPKQCQQPIREFLMTSSLRLVLDTSDHAPGEGSPHGDTAFLGTTPPARMCSPIAFAVRHLSQSYAERISQTPPGSPAQPSHHSRVRMSDYFDQASPPFSRQSTPPSVQPTVDADAAADLARVRVGHKGVIFTLTNTMVGAGALGVPFVFPLAGIGLSVAVCTIVVIAMLVTSLCLLRSLDVVASRRRIANNEELDFGVLGEAAFGSIGRRSINALIALELTLGAVSFFIFIGSNATFCLKGLGIIIDSWIPILCSGVISFGLLYAPANVLSIVSLISILFMAMLLGVLVDAGMSMPKRALQVETLIYVDFEGALQALGVFLFCFCGAPCIPSIYADAREPRRFPSALVISFSLAALYFISCGICGYIFYGAEVGANFTDNLGYDLSGKPLLGGKVLPMLAAFGIAIKLQGTMPIVMVAVLSALGQTGPVSRIVFISVTCSMAIGAREELDKLMSCTGLLATMGTSVLFPIAVYLRLNKPGRMAKCVLGLMLIATTVFSVVGTVQQVVKLVHGKS